MVSLCTIAGRMKSSLGCFPWSSSFALGHIQAPGPSRHILGCLPGPCIHLLLYLLHLEPGLSTCMSVAKHQHVLADSRTGHENPLSAQLRGLEALCLGYAAQGKMIPRITLKIHLVKCTTTFGTMFPSILETRLLICSLPLAMPLPSGKLHAVRWLFLNTRVHVCNKDDPS